MVVATKDRLAEKPVRAATVDSRSEILAAAADCFKERGYSATSIDDVARRLRATKGMIYHHFRSKTDLFFAVYQRGMEINFACIEPYRNQPGPALERLARMSYAHAVTMMAEQAFQRTQAQGVDMHLSGATTAAQREMLDKLIASRDEYEAIFRSASDAVVLEEGLSLKDTSLAVKNYLSVLNATVYWYSPRTDDLRKEQDELACDVLNFALRGLGAEPPKLDYSRSMKELTDE